MSRIATITINHHSQAPGIRGPSSFERTKTTMFASTISLTAPVTREALTAALQAGDYESYVGKQTALGLPVKPFEKWVAKWGTEGTKVESRFIGVVRKSLTPDQKKGLGGK